jgi:hypothetical protein
MLSIFDSIKTYLIGISAFIGLAMVGIIQYLSRKNKQLEHENSVFKRIEEIQAEQIAQRAEIIETEERRINVNVDKFKKSNKSKRDRLNSL